jgi:hypothetical protein
MRASPNGSATDGRTSRSPEFQCLGQLLVRTPAGEEDVRDADLSDRLERMLAFHSPGWAADEDERAGPLECALGARVGADQEGSRLTAVKRPR